MLTRRGIKRLATAYLIVATSAIIFGSSLIGCIVFDSAGPTMHLHVHYAEVQRVVIARNSGVHTP